jgi:uncharacterized protein (DUF1697 family)
MLTCYVVLLRGINLGARNRVSMPELREGLEGAGFRGVRTHLQSGNVILSSRAGAKTVAATCVRVLERLGLDVKVVVRTRDQLARIVARDPLGGVATDPKRYQVTFLDGRLNAATVRSLRKLAVDGERVVKAGSELYAWHPRGVGRSKLASALSGPKLGATATARNWSTVTKLLELADDCES